MALAPVDIRHNPAAQRFETTVDGHLSVAEYKEASGRILFTHTFVPPELRGRGIAEQLVRTALEWARHRGLPIEPQCAYVARYVERHPEFSTLAG
jgi:uncharacterized protein